MFAGQDESVNMLIVDRLLIAVNNRSGLKLFALAGGIADLTAQNTADLAGRRDHRRCAQEICQNVNVLHRDIPRSLAVRMQCAGTSCDGIIQRDIVRVACDMPVDIAGRGDLGIELNQERHSPVVRRAVSHSPFLIDACIDSGISVFTLDSVVENTEGFGIFRREADKTCAGGHVIPLLAGVDFISENPVIHGSDCAGIPLSQEGGDRRQSLDTGRIRRIEHVIVCAAVAS